MCVLFGSVNMNIKRVTFQPLFQPLFQPRFSRVVATGDAGGAGATGGKSERLFYVFTFVVVICFLSE